MKINKKVLHTMKVKTEKPIEVKNELMINVHGHYIIKYLQ